MSFRRVLANRTATVELTLLDQDGAPRTAAATPTVIATRLDGSTVTPTSVEGVGEGLIAIGFAAGDLPAPDVLTITATSLDGSVDRMWVEVVGNYYFSIFEARGRDANLQKVDKYPDEDIILVRAEVEDECEQICGQAFVPRARLVLVDGEGTDAIELPFSITRIRGGSVGGVALTTDDIGRLQVDDFGGIRRQYGHFPRGYHNVSLVVEYGAPTPPADLKAATIRRLRERLNSNTGGVPSRATAMVQDGNTFQIATPGRGGFETGNPEVDAVYARYRLGPSVR